MTGSAGPRSLVAEVGDDDTRFLILLVGLVFVFLFGAMTLFVLAKDGFTILVFFSIVIVALLGVAIWGAINDTENRR